LPTPTVPRLISLRVKAIFTYAAMERIPPWRHFGKI